MNVISLKVTAFDFSNDYGLIFLRNIFNIHEYLKKKSKMILKLMFMGILGFARQLDTQKAKCLSLNNEPCLARLTFIDLNPDELRYYPYMANLNSCLGSYNTLIYPSTMILDSSDRSCVPDKS